MLFSDKLYDLLNRTCVSNKNIAFFIRIAHYWSLILSFHLACTCSKTYLYFMILNTLLIIVGYLYFQGCLVTTIENKLSCEELYFSDFFLEIYNGKSIDYNVVDEKLNVQRYMFGLMALITILCFYIYNIIVRCSI